MEVTYRIECLEEDTPVRGNALDSGDKAYDKQVEDEILARLHSDDLWAWCCVRVVATVTVDGQTFEGDDYLGCSSYTDEADFKAGGYFEDMKKTALENLAVSLNNAVLHGETAKKVQAFLFPNAS